MSEPLNKRWKRFVLSEGNKPSVGVWVQTLSDNLNLFRAKTMQESKRIESMKFQLNEIKKSCVRLQKENQILKEENEILLQEKKENER
jgi:hypothetical protein